MSSTNIFIAHPATDEQLNALKAFVKAIKVKFEIVKGEQLEETFPTKKDILHNLKTGLEEVKLFKKGKLETTSANAFLNEL